MLHLGNKDMPEDLELMSFLSKISGGLSKGINDSHVDELFDTLFAELAQIFKADYAYVQFQSISQISANNVIQKAYRIPTDLCSNLLLVVTKNTDSTVLDSNFKYVFDAADIAHERTYQSAKDLEIKSFVSIPILGTDRNNASINFYYTENLKIEPSIIGKMNTLAELLIFSYDIAISRSKQDYSVLHRRNYFMNSYELILVLDDNYFIIDKNNRANDLVGFETTGVNFPSMLINQIFKDKFFSVIRNLDYGDYSEEINLTLISPKPKIGELVLNCGIVKFLENQETKMIISARVLSQQEIFVENADEDHLLFPQIESFNKLFIKDREEAIDKFKPIFFPAAYSLAVNEASGPIIISTCPEVSNDEDHDMLYTDVIKLMAGLNTEQLKEQVFLTGSTPWSIPKGNLNWIAFTIENPEARGNIETHLVGLVTRNYLLDAKPAFLQSINTALMGTMNEYISIINDDDADFITYQYDDDRFFSTVTIINEALAQMRYMVTMLLGTSTYTKNT